MWRGGCTGRRSDVCGGEGAWGEEVTYVEGRVHGEKK